MGHGAYSSTSRRGCSHWLPPGSSSEARDVEPSLWPVGRPGRSGLHPSPGSCSMGCGSRSSRPTIPTTIRVSLIKPEDTLMDYLVHVWVRRSRLERHPTTRWPGNILPSWSHVVATGQPDPSLTKAVYPSVGPLGQRRRWQQRSTTRSLLVGTTHGRHCCRGLEGRMGVLEDELMIQ